MPVAAVAHRTLLLSLATALAISNMAAAQSVPTAGHTYQVIKLNYAPARATAGLDLRPGEYLLQLSGPRSGPFVGKLRGPNNEIVSDNLQLTASSCAAGVSADALLKTRALPAQAGLEVLQIEISASAGGCMLGGTVPTAGKVAAKVDWQELDCDPFGESDQLGPDEEGSTEDPGPQCNEIPMGLTSAPPRPDLQPDPMILLGQTWARLGGVVRLRAEDAIVHSHGRCEFPYSLLARNLGRATSRATDVSLLSASRLGLQLDQRMLAPLAPGAADRVEGALMLPPGIWQIYVHLDSRGQVAESRGLNNAVPLVVQVEGDCR